VTAFTAIENLRKIDCGPPSQIKRHIGYKGLGEFCAATKCVMLVCWQKEKKGTYRLLSHYWVMMNHWWRIVDELSPRDEYVMGVWEEICKAIS